MDHLIDVNPREDLWEGQLTTLDGQTRPCPVHSLLKITGTLIIFLEIDIRAKIEGMIEPKVKPKIKVKVEVEPKPKL